jgi:hypothetical protein
MIKYTDYDVGVILVCIFLVFAMASVWSMLGEAASTDVKRQCQEHNISFEEVQKLHEETGYSNYTCFIILLKEENQ